MITLINLHGKSQFITHGIKDIFARQHSTGYPIFLKNFRLLSGTFPEASKNYTSNKNQRVQYSSLTIGFKSSNMVSSNKTSRTANILLSKRLNSNKVTTGLTANKEPPADPIINKEKIRVEAEVPLTKVQMLKKAVAEYGSTVIIFHVSISLVSLAVCYMLVSSGVDASQVFETLGMSQSKIAANAGTFVAAYAIHKVMAPLRISITLGATPLIVRYLRNKGILKK